MKSSKFIATTTTMLCLLLSWSSCESNGLEKPIVSSDKDSEDSEMQPFVPKEVEDPRVILTISKETLRKGSIRLEINAKPEDRENVWIDLNKNGKKDNGEEVKEFQGRGYEPSQTYKLANDVYEVTIHGKLTYLNCENNDLIGLDITNCPSLIDLECFHNEIEELDLSQNEGMTILTCDDNKIQNLDISGLSRLQFLYCDRNKLEKLDVTHNKKLKLLDCSANRIESLDISQNTELFFLAYSQNPLKVDRSMNKKLTHLYCSDTNEEELDLSHHPELEELTCASNPKLLKLNLSNNPKLVMLSCGFCNLEELDLSHNPKLLGLSCGNNRLTRLDVSNNPRIYAISVYGNNLKKEALEALYRSMPDVRNLHPKPFERDRHRSPNEEVDKVFVSKEINITGNPGAKVARQDYIINRGWKVLNF